MLSTCRSVLASECQSAWKVDPIPACNLAPCVVSACCPLTPMPVRPRFGGVAQAASRLRKRQLSLPVSTMSQWWVSRSRSAVVILASPKTDGQAVAAIVRMTGGNLPAAASPIRPDRAHPADQRHERHHGGGGRSGTQHARDRGHVTLAALRLTPTCRHGATSLRLSYGRREKKII